MPLSRLRHSDRQQLVDGAVERQSEGRDRDDRVEGEELPDLKITNMTAVGTDADPRPRPEHRALDLRLMRLPRGPEPKPDADTSSQMDHRAFFGLCVSEGFGVPCTPEAYALPHLSCPEGATRSERSLGTRVAFLGRQDSRGLLEFSPTSSVAVARSTTCRRMPDQPLWWHSRPVETVRTSAQRVAAVGEPDRRSLREPALIREDSVGPPAAPRPTVSYRTRRHHRLGGPRLASLEDR